MLLNVGKSLHAFCVPTLTGLSETRLYVRQDFDLLRDGSDVFSLILHGSLYNLYDQLSHLILHSLLFRAESVAKNVSVSCTDVTSTLLALMEKFCILATHEKHSRSLLSGQGCQDSPD